MAYIEINGKQIELDEDGFMVEPDEWSEEIALYFAKEESVDELTEAHWALINYLKNYYKQFGIAPMVRKVCKDNNLTLAQVYELFPTGPGKGACKIAGLPKPTGCV